MYTYDSYKAATTAAAKAYKAESKQLDKAAESALTQVINLTAAKVIFNRLNPSAKKKEFSNRIAKEVYGLESFTGSPIRDAAYNRLNIADWLIDEHSLQEIDSESDLLPAIKSVVGKSSYTQLVASMKAARKAAKATKQDNSQDNSQDSNQDSNQDGGQSQDSAPAAKSALNILHESIADVIINFELAKNEDENAANFAIEFLLKKLNVIESEEESKDVA